MTKNRHRNEQQASTRAGDPVMNRAGDADPAGIVVQERWEYRLDYPGLADGSDEALQRALNGAGLDGWEIVTYSFKARQVLMKRKIA